MRQNLGANSGSREPDPQAVPALSGFDPGRMAWLHIRGQFSYHGEAYIVGSRQGLTALRAAIDEALASGEGEAIAMSNDGEGYAVTVRRTSRLRDMGRPPYIDRLAREVADIERDYMQKAQRHNWCIYAKLKEAQARAIEAQRATTPQSGVVHESAVAESDLPKE